MLESAISRRSFLRSAAAALAVYSLPGCGSGSRVQIDPGAVLKEMRENDVIRQLEKGKIFFKYKDHFSDRGKDALKIVQRGLCCLALIRTRPEKFKGVYGDETVRAVDYLQVWAGSREANGQVFDRNGLITLQKALQEKIAGRWVVPEIF